jgi:UDP-N-acetylmuramoyl-tripeptide--D-alanyl-D-alanine ligase
MKEPLQTGPSGRVPVPPENRSLINSLGKPGAKSVPTGRRLVKAVLLPLCAWRRRLDRHTRCIAVTGSTAKSTTKELICGVLGVRHRVHRSRDSMNRAGELARAILTTPPWCDYLVLELGAGGSGTLDELIDMSRPDVGVLTHIQRDHYRAFGSVDAIAAEKFKVVRRLPSDGVAVINADDPKQTERLPELAGQRVLTYGLSPTARVTAVDVVSSWPEGLAGKLVIDGVAWPFVTRLLGKHWIHSVLAAAAVGTALGVPGEDIVTGLAATEPVRGRLSVVRDGGGVAFIEDWCKGAETSCAPALACLSSVRKGRRIAVIGTIADIPGKPSPVYRRVATEALAAADLVFFVGLMSQRVRSVATQSAGRLRMFETLTELFPAIDAELRPGDVVLVKGSQRADHLERLVQHRLGEPVCFRARCGSGKPCFTCRLRKKA